MRLFVKVQKPLLIVYFAIFSSTLAFAQTASTPATSGFTEEFHPGAKSQGSGWMPVVDALDNSWHMLPYEIIDGVAVYEGDMELGPVPEEVTSSGGVSYGVATLQVGTRWKNGLIPYSFDSGFELDGQGAVADAIAHLEANTSLRFVPRTSETDYIEFIHGTGCSSGIGRVGGKQTIKLKSSCYRDGRRVGTPAHEILHANGVYHEQTRIDRDNYVTINFANIQSGKEHNFAKSDTRSIKGSDIGSYDYGSVMHYSATSFSTDKSTPLYTIVPKPPVSISAIGQRSGLSASDIATVQYLYYTNLGVSLTAPANATSGQAVQATITVDNTGDTAIGDIIARKVHIDIPLPVGNYSSFSSTDAWACNYNTGSTKVECNLPILDRNASSTVTLNLIAPAINNWNLQATVSGENRDIITGNNSDSETITVSGVPAPTPTPSSPSSGGGGGGSLSLYMLVLLLLSQHRIRKTVHSLVFTQK